MSLNKSYEKAKKEGRLCVSCGWIVTVLRWKKGLRTCGNCEDAHKGVNINYGHSQPLQEKVDETGEML